MTKYGHKGNAKVTTLAAGVSPTDLTITGADLTGWPDGTTGPFWASMDKGTLTEEKILCSGRSGNVLQVLTDVSGNGRGMDDTVAQAHGINATLEHVWTATEAEEASTHVNTTDGAHGYPPITSIVTQGGVAQGMTEVTLTGAQAEAEFRVRATYIGTGAPSNSIGNDGDLYIQKG